MMDAWEQPTSEIIVTINRKVFFTLDYFHYKVANDCSFYLHCKAGKMPGEWPLETPPSLPTLLITTNSIMTVR